MSPARRLAAVLTTFLMLAVGACGLTNDSSPLRYVALGDSFTSGPGLGDTKPGGARCVRTAGNYPTSVASTLDADLTDVSCGSATTKTLLEGAKGIKPQIEAVDAKTQLVTVGIGGNDLAYYNQLIFSCPAISRPGGDGTPCRDRLESRAQELTPVIGDHIGQVLANINDRAPGAEVVLVGYLRYIPGDGAGCANVPATSGDVAWMASVEKRLSEQMAATAAAHDAHFVPMYTISEGHDMCAGDEAWVNGPRPTGDDGILLHPNKAGEQAMAEAVVATIRESGIT